MVALAVVIDLFVPPLLGSDEYGLLLDEPL
jgi:hypothetical protein